MVNNSTFVIDVRYGDYGRGQAMDVSCKMKDDSRHRFEEIYSKNLQKVIFCANSYINDMGEAENIAHDVFAALWRNFDSIEYDRAVGYIYTTTKNMCLNTLRRRSIAQKYSSYQKKTDYLNAIALENGNHSTDIYEKEMQDILGQGMNQMKTKVKRTFLLSRVNGLKNREIAEIEGVAESTIEARISSALLIMRRLFQDYLK